MKIVDYQIKPDRTVRVTFEDERTYTWDLGGLAERKALIKAELIKTAGAKGEKRPDENILDIQSTIFESELIAPLDAIPATFTFARQSSSFVDLAALTKAFCTKTFKIELRRVRLCKRIRAAVIDERIKAADLSHLSDRDLYDAQTKIVESVPAVDLPLAVAERVDQMPVAKQIEFLPKQIK